MTSPNNIFLCLTEHALRSLTENTHLIAWRNPTVKLKDGTPSAGKRILIDGQQRVTALMAGLLGRDVLTKDYETVRIRIAFQPQLEKFEVANPAISKDVAWIEDVAAVFAPKR